MLPWDSTDQESKRRSVQNRLTLHEVLQHAWCCGEAAPLTADLLARRTAVADTADLFAALEARDVHCSPSEAAQVDPGHAGNYYRTAHEPRALDRVSGLTSGSGV